MKKGEQRVTYWVMYSERVQRNVAAWNEPPNIQWVEREAQHCGVVNLAAAERMKGDLQPYVNDRTHFLERERSGPDAHHLIEVWIEIEHRCRLEDQPSNVTIPSITAPSLGASKE